MAKSTTVNEFINPLKVFVLKNKLGTYEKMFSFIKIYYLKYLHHQNELLTFTRCNCYVKEQSLL